MVIKTAPSNEISGFFGHTYAQEKIGHPKRRGVSMELPVRVRRPPSKMELANRSGSWHRFLWTFFSPTAIALESSAIVKVSGQKSFRALCGSLGQIRVGLPKGSAEGSTKVPLRFHRGSTKVSRRLRKFRDLRDLLGQIPFMSERFCKGFPHHFFTFVSQFLQLFFASF